MEWLAQPNNKYSVLLLKILFQAQKPIGYVIILSYILIWRDVSAKEMLP